MVQVVLLLAQVEILLGFQDTNKISFCLTQGIPLPLAFAGGGALTAVVFVGFGVLAMRFVVFKWVGAREEAGQGMGQRIGVEGKEELDGNVSRFSR